MADIDMNSAYKSLVPNVINSISERSFLANSKNNEESVKKIKLPEIINMSPRMIDEQYYATPLNKEKECYNESSNSKKKMNCSDSFDFLGDSDSLKNGKKTEHKRGRSVGNVFNSNKENTPMSLTKDNPMSEFNQQSEKQFYNTTQTTQAKNNFKNEVFRSSESYTYKPVEEPVMKNEQKRCSSLINKYHGTRMQLQEFYNRWLASRENDDETLQPEDWVTTTKLSDNDLYPAFSTTQAINQDHKMDKLLKGNLLDEFSKDSTYKQCKTSEQTKKIDIQSLFKTTQDLTRKNQNREWSFDSKHKDNSKEERIKINY